MRAVIQRVSQAQVTVDGAAVGSIGAGLLVLLGVSHDDADTDASYLACISHSGASKKPPTLA